MASIKASINLQPQVLDLDLYAGDGVSLRFTCLDKDQEPVDVTGTVRAQIRTARLDTDPPIVTFAVNVTDAYIGIVVITLTGDQTQELLDAAATPGRFTGVWDLEWDAADDEPRTLCQGAVSCVADVTR